MNFHLQLQTPEIEIPIIIIDGSGKKAKCVLGFIRYERDEARTKLEKLLEIINNEGAGIDEVFDYMKDDILYIKGLTIVTETGKDYIIQDSRTIPKNAPIYEENSTNLTSILVDKLSKSTPYAHKMVEAYQIALTNIEMTREISETKNS